MAIIEGLPDETKIEGGIQLSLGREFQSFWVTMEVALSQIATCPASDGRGNQSRAFEDDLSEWVDLYGRRQLWLLVQ